MKKKKPNELNYNDVSYLKQLFEAFDNAISMGSFVVPGRMSYAISRNEAKITSAFMNFEKMRIDALDPYIKKDDDGNPVMKKDDKGNPTGRLEVTDEKVVERIFKEFQEKTQKVELYQFMDLESMIDQVKGEHKAMEVLWQLVDRINATIDNKILKPA